MALAIQSACTSTSNATYDNVLFEKSLNVLEERAFQIDIITSFEERGWALYEFGNGGPLASYLDLQHIVEEGRETARLKFGVKYLPLPLSEHDRSWPVVRDMLYMLASQGRGPYFVDMEEDRDKETGELWVEAIGSYLVDSVILDPPYLRLVIDARMSRIKDPSRIAQFRNCEIPLHVTCTHVLRRQLMKAVRWI